MEPYYGHMHTFGPTERGMGVDAGGHQFFGNAPAAKSMLPPRVKLIDLLQKDKLGLWQGIGAAGENAAAATAGGATVALLSGAVLTGLAVQYAIGRYIGAPAIEYFSGNKLTQKQKNAVGITTMIF
jgi:hypothetical protein